MSHHYHLWFDQAHLAVQQQDWATLNQLLRQILWQADDQHFVPHKPHILDFSLRQDCLDLALKCLQYGDFQSRWDIAKLFPTFETLAIQPLTALIQHPDTDWEAQWFSIRILGSISDPQVPKILVELLQSWDVESLVDEADEDSEETDLRTAIMDALIQQGKSAIASLQILLLQPETRCLSVRALAQIRTKETIAPLTEMVHDPAADVRELAIEALSSFHDPSIPPLLVAALNDPSAAVRKVAVAGLGVRPDLAEDYGLLPLLKARLWDTHPGVCQQAAIALGRLGLPEVIPALVEYISTAGVATDLQLTAIRSLAWIPDVAVLGALRSLLLDPALAPTLSVLLHAEIATQLTQVKAHPDQAANISREALQSNLPWLADITIQQVLILSLGQVGEWHVIDVLLPYLAHPELTLRLHAIAALKQLDALRSYQHLTQVLQDPTLAPDLKAGIEDALSTWQPFSDSSEANWSSQTDVN